MEIKDALKKRRLELGLTLLDVANKIGVSEATVSRWESGNIANMRRDKIAMLAKTLKISPAIIMGWEEEDELSGIEGISSISKKRLPLLGNIACGEPIYASEDRESYVEVGSDIQADFCPGRRAGSDLRPVGFRHDGRQHFPRIHVADSGGRGQYRPL